MVRTIIAEDHRLVMAGFRSLLETIAGIVVVGEADNGRDAVRLAKSTRADLVLMDIGMGELNGIEATEMIKAESPGIHVLIVSMHAAKAIVFRALQAGASGYLLKECAPMELELAVAAILRGEIYLSPKISRHVVAGLTRDARSSASGEPDLRSLTLRQREILQLIVEGKSTKEIAHALGVSAKTVETHRAALMKRLDIHSVAELVMFGIRNKLVPFDPPD